MTAVPDVAVVGGGIIGLSVAWRCAQRGMSVTVFDPDADDAASTVAAGMLAPVGEAYFGEDDLTALMLAAARRWPGFAAELARHGDVGYLGGTLVAALTRDDLAAAERLWRYQEKLGLPVRQVTVAESRRIEPALTPRLRGAAVLDDHQVDPRKVVRVLRAAAATEGVRFVRRLIGSLDEVEARQVVVAAGVGSAALTGLPVRPVKGQVLRLRAPEGVPGFRHVIRGYADGRQVYLVPRPDGEVVVGASQEERTDRTPTAGVVLDLLRAATDLVPEIAEYALVEVSVGLRPGTPDNGPIVGRLPDGAVVATGHFRHGILLAPLTADAVVELLVEGRVPELFATYGPERFPAARAAGRERP